MEQKLKRKEKGKGKDKEKVKVKVKEEQEVQKQEQEVQKQEQEVQKQEQEQEVQKQEQKQEQASGMYKPCLQATRGFGNSMDGLDDMTIDECETMREMEESKLVGASAVADLKDVDMAERGGPSSEVKSEEKVVEGSLGKRRRGRPPKGQVKTTPRPPPSSKMNDEEDVCFICFDGGSLVLCDRRGCPKAYHPACIKRDEAFFRSKAKWNCGWHICSTCQKASHHMCYTCTYSVCRGCIKDADYVGVKGNKGFCRTCFKTIMLIENAGKEDKETIKVDFDDKSSWEYLFKVYWLYLKGKLSLTVNELTKAKNHWKEDRVVSPKVESSDLKGGLLDGSCGDVAACHSKKRKITTEPILHNKAESHNTQTLDSYKRLPLPEGKKWASNELLEFVSHMRNGDTSVLSQFDVQALLLEYVKRHDLRETKQQSQIVCDFRLINVFGKERVGHFEMLKLIESHFLTQESSSTTVSIKGGANGVIPFQVAAEGNNDIQMTENRKRQKSQSKNDEKESLKYSNEYAAIDIHNINLIYLRRNVLENLIDDTDNFHDKVVGLMVRIRIAGSDQKEDKYRLVQVVGTSKVPNSYKIGSKTTNFMLEILNKDKKELISIDEVSNQDFSKDECERLRESIKCGLIKRPTVGEIKDQFTKFQAVTVDDGLKAEIVRLSHLRDRASEKGHRKQLRECVEKLDRLKSPEERQKRIPEMPEVHCDPKMDPTYVVEKNGEIDAMKQDNEMRARSLGFSKKEIDPASLQKGGDVSSDARNYEQTNMVPSVDKDNATQVHENVDRSASKQERETLGLNSSDTPKILIESFDSALNNSTVARPKLCGVKDFPSQDTTGMEQPVDDTEAHRVIWHYQDPTARIQGPFSLFQLRKWSTSGLFPLDLKIWRINEKQDKSILLIDAIDKCFHNEEILLHKVVQEIRVDSTNNNQNSERNTSVTAPQVDGKKVELSWNSTCNDMSANSNDHEVVRNSNSNGADSSALTSTNRAIVSSSIKRQAESVVSEWDSLKVDNLLDNKAQLSSSLPSHMLSGNPRGSLPHESREESGAQRWISSQGDLNGNSIKNVESDNEKKESSETQCDIKGEGEQNPSCTQNLKDKPVGLSPNVWGSNSTFLSLSTTMENSKQNLEIDFLEFPNPTPKTRNEGLIGQGAKTKQSVSLSAPIPTSGLSWSTASSLPGALGQLPEVPIEWSQCSHNPTKPSVVEWDPTGHMSSVKPTEHDATLTLGSAQLNHSSPPHPARNASDWPTIVTEPNECDESVSDLLAEVEAMESLNGLPSPTSILRELTEGCENDCFSPVEGLSPTPDPSKSDALSSTNDLQMTQLNEPLVLSHSDFFNCQKFSGGTSSTSVEVKEERKPKDVSLNQRKAESQIQTLVPPVTNWGITNTNTESPWGVRTETFTAPSPLPAVQNNSNLAWGGIPDASLAGDWGARQEKSHDSISISLGNGTGNLSAYGSQPKYSGDRTSGHGGDRSYGHGVDRSSGPVGDRSSGNGGDRTSGYGDRTSGYGGDRSAVHQGDRSSFHGGDRSSSHTGDRSNQRDRDFQGRNVASGRNRSVWNSNNRQSSFGGTHGVGSFRAPPKGQRVCKFYESGCCKKGASCSYWHS